MQKALTKLAGMLRYDYKGKHEKVRRMGEWVKVGKWVKVGTRGEMEEHKQKVVVGVPVTLPRTQGWRHACTVLGVGITVISLFALGLLNSRNPEDQRVGDRVLKVTEMADKVHEVFCRC